MKLKLLIGVLVFLIVLNLATIGTFLYTQWKRNSAYQMPLAPEPEHNVSRPHMPDGNERAGSPRPPGIRLHQEKRTQLRRLLNEFHVETSDSQTRIRELENLAFSIMQRDTVPRDSLDIVLEEISKLRLDINRSAFEKLLKAKAYLAPAQQRMFFKAVLEARPDQRERLHRYRGQRQKSHDDSD